jgi:flagellar FliL protein
MAKGKDNHKEAPSEAVAEGGEGAEGDKKKGPPLMILIGAGVGALLLIGGGGVGVGLMLGGGKSAAPPPKAAPHKAPKKEAAKDEKGKSGPSPISEGPDGVVFYTMPELVVNLQGPDGRPTFLKLSLAFEVPDQDTADAITPDVPRLKDMFDGFLRELRPDDLSGSQGSYQLRMEIQRRVNLVIAPAKVNAVLIQEMLIQ